MSINFSLLKNRTQGRLLYSFYAFVIGVAIPISWLLYRAFIVRRKWWIEWTRIEVSDHREIYLALSIIGLFIFILLGYFLENETTKMLKAAAKVKDANLELAQLATTDGLTKLFNARYMHERMIIEMENSHRSVLSCLLIDIDWFKKINDQYGHPVGDDVLVYVANALKRAVRKVDLVGRLGGEEFLILLPETPAFRAFEIAERIRTKIATEPYQFGQNSIPITASIGVVTYPDEGLSNEQSLLKAADDALYTAKNAGRNKAILWNKPKSVFA